MREKRDRRTRFRARKASTPAWPLLACLRQDGQWYQARGCGWASEAQSKSPGLHYNWYRSYDPSLGRYTQPDPLGFVDGPSVYGYAIANLQRFVDRDGLKLSKWDTFKTIAHFCLEVFDGLTGSNFSGGRPKIPNRPPIERKQDRFEPEGPKFKDSRDPPKPPVEPPAPPPPPPGPPPIGHNQPPT